MRAERMASDLAQLHALASALGRAGSATEIAAIVVEQIVEGVGATGAGIYVRDLERGEASLLDVGGELDRGLLPDAVSLTSAGTIPDAIRLARGIWLATDEDWETVGDAGDWRALGADSVGVVPLVVEDAAIGALFVTFRSPARAGPEDQRFVETVARQAAQPFDRMRLLEVEQASRIRAERAGEQIRRLQAVTERLSAAATMADVAEVMVNEGRALFSADAALVHVPIDDPHVFRLLATHGDDGSVVERAQEGSADSPSPITHAFTAGATIGIGDREHLVESYPAFGDAIDGSPLRSLLCIPLIVGRAAVGVVTVGFHEERLFDDGDHRTAVILGRQCAQALDRAQKLRDGALDRRDAAAERPARDVAVDGGRDGRRPLSRGHGRQWTSVGTGSTRSRSRTARLGFVVGDVVGKGVQAAATMAQLRNGMRALTLDTSDPAVIVTKLNRLLEGYTDAPFATLLFVTVDPRTHEALIVSAGHLPRARARPRPRPPAARGRARSAARRRSGWDLHERDGDAGAGNGARPVHRRARRAPGSPARHRSRAAQPRRDRGDRGPPEELVDFLIDRMIGDAPRGDDVAVLAVAFDRAPLGTFNAVLPADHDALVELRHSFGRWLDRSGITDLDRRDLLLATWEASANAIEHARSRRRPSSTVDAALTGDTRTGPGRRHRRVA